MKKILSLLLVLAMSFLMVGALADGETIEVAVTYTGEQLEVFQGLLAKFEEQTGIKVNLDLYGDDYESTLKTRMSSNDMPDIWQTHGWSLLRYKEYLMPLNDQPWYSDLDASGLGVIADDDGTIYVLMISELVNATLVDLTVCEAAGVDPYAIYDWDDFTAACAKIKEAGYTPIGNTANPGSLANIAGTWVTYEGEKKELGAEQIDGTCDWEDFKIVLEDWANWLESGYLFEDVGTMSSNDSRERWAQDKAAFWLGNDTSYLINARLLNPNARYAFIPTFASTKEGKQFVGIGEGDTFGIWKDTKNVDAAKKFLERMAKPENAGAMNKVSGKISSLKSVVNDEDYGQALFAETQEKYPDVYYDNLWDRKFMPSGMWPIFDTACRMLFEDWSADGIQEVTDYLAENYTDLWENAHQ